MIISHNTFLSSDWWKTSPYGFWVVEDPLVVHSHYFLSLNPFKEIETNNYKRPKLSFHTHLPLPMQHNIHLLPQSSIQPYAIRNWNCKSTRCRLYEMIESLNLTPYRMEPVQYWLESSTIWTRSHISLNYFLKKYKFIILPIKIYQQIYHFTLMKWGKAVLPF